MKKKFDGYTVEVKVLDKKTFRNTGITEAEIEIKGNIEIGIDIDSWTWRGDWIKKVVFKDKADLYDLIEVSNDLQDGWTKNNVIAKFRKRFSW